MSSIHINKSTISIVGLFFKKGILGMENAKLYDWIYSNELKLKYSYTPGVEEGSFARIKRIFTAPREFSLKNYLH